MLKHGLIAARTAEKEIPRRMLRQAFFAWHIAES